MNSFDLALKQLPESCRGKYDPLSHKSVADLIYCAQHELDMYEEGEESDIKSDREAQKVRYYIKAFKMTNPQYTLTVALGVGEEGLKRRELYEKVAGDKPLSQWVREALDKAAERELRK